MAGMNKAGAIKGALDAAMRASIPATKFGLPKKRKVTVKPVSK